MQAAANASLDAMGAKLHASCDDLLVTLVSIVLRNTIEPGSLITRASACAVPKIRALSWGLLHSKLHRRSEEAEMVDA
jgi:hypothetical protein